MYTVQSFGKGKEHQVCLSDDHNLRKLLLRRRKHWICPKALTYHLPNIGISDLWSLRGKGQQMPAG